jgi:O-antigen ligase
VLNVSRFNSHFPALNALRPALLLAIATAAFAFLNPSFLAKTHVLDSLQGKTILGLGIMASLSTVFGISMGGSALFMITEYSKVLITAFLIIAAIRHGGDLLLFAWAYVIATGILVWMAWFVFEVSTFGSKVARLSNLYTFDANDLGLVLLIGLVLSLLTFQSSKLPGKIVSVTVMLGVGATIARSGSRGALIGLVVVAVTLLIMMKTVPLHKRLLTVGAVVLSLVLAAGPGYWEQMRTMLSPKEDYNWTSTTGRKETLKRGIGYMIQHPVFGLGISNFGRAECLDTESERAAQSQLIGIGVKCTSPHNTWLQAGTELGVPGLGLWVLLTFGTVVGMNRLRRKLPRAWSRGDPESRFLYAASVYLPVAMIAFMASSTFLSFAWIDIAYILAGFAVGLQQAARVRLRREHPSVLPRQASVSSRRRTRLGHIPPGRVVIP